LVGQQPASAPYQDPNLSLERRAADLVSRMTLEEKILQMQNSAPAIPRLGVPVYNWWNEALHGVATGRATVFPESIGLGATWDVDLVHRVADAISTEARAKYHEALRHDPIPEVPPGNAPGRVAGLTYWSPNINIFRDPRWGRGQETYGEDPFLTGRMGIAFISGVQGPDLNHLRAVATSKHFAVHSGPESLRHAFNVDPTPRDLEETYLPAFRASVTEGKVQSVMCAYNSIDAFPACANKMLLEEHLRKAWGFKGFVVSDCGAIVDVFNGHKKAADIEHASAISLQAGTDLSCSIWSAGFNTLAKAVNDGLATEAEVTTATERLYTARFQLGLFDPQGVNPLDRIPHTDVASEANRAKALRAAEESIVLLKNDGTLPLKRSTKRIAVVGPTADLLASILGNYVGTPLHPVTPLDGMLADKTREVLYAQGSSLAAGFAVPVPRTVFGIKNGLKTEMFATPDWTGRPVAVTTEPAVQTDWEDARPAPQVDTVNYSVRWSGSITAPAAGHYVFSLDVGDSFPHSPKESYRLIIDGKVLGEGSLRQAIDISVMGNFKVMEGASPTAPPLMDFPKPPSIPYDFADTQPHTFVLEYSHSGDRAGGGVTLNWEAPAQAQLDEAVAQVKQADVVVAYVGLSPNLEGEEMRIKLDGFAGGDRTSIDLPAVQQKLLETVAATGKPLVVVLQSGSPVALNWAKDHANAVLAAWYPGIEGGTAIRHTLDGTNNPAGRLPLTFYAGVDDLPAFTDYSMKNRTYRYYTGKPLWGFGYGLSYTKFTYGPVKLSAESLKAGDPITATLTVINAGTVAGDEVIEAYLKTPQADGPRHSLVAFERVRLTPGASRQVSLKIDPRSLSSVDEQGNRSILEGKYTLAVGGAQPEETQAKSEAVFTVNGTAALPK